MFWQNLFQKSSRAIKETLEVTLPELGAHIIDRGIYLAGGSSQLRGLQELISKETKMQVHIPEKPLDCVALGTSIKLKGIIIIKDLLKAVVSS